MHDFLHVEHLFFDLPDLPSDFKYFVKIVNICTNYLANSLSDFSEIIPQNSEKCISAHPNFQNFPGEHAPGPPREGEGRPSPWSRGDHKFWGLKIPRPPPPPPCDSNPGSATGSSSGRKNQWREASLLNLPHPLSILPFLFCLVLPVNSCERLGAMRACMGVEHPDVKVRNLVLHDPKILLLECRAGLRRLRWLTLTETALHRRVAGEARP